MEQRFVPALIGMNDLMNVQRQIEQLNDYADMYHLDIIDWHFAKNMFISPMFIQHLRPITNALLDVHIMLEGLQLDIIEAVIDAECDIVSLHAEDIQRNVFKFISYIKGRGKKVGIVLNPSVSLDMMRYYIEQVDLLTFMGVTPGFPKQDLIPCVLDKIREAHELREKHGYSFKTMIDGGCHEKTMKMVADTNVDHIVMGNTCLFGKDEDLRKAWRMMEDDFHTWTKAG